MLGELCLSFPKQEKVFSGKGPFSIAQECDHIEEKFGQLYYAEALRDQSIQWHRHIVAAHRIFQTHYAIDAPQCGQWV